jgi:PAS domain S-box-containing protein
VHSAKIDAWSRRAVSDIDVWSEGRLVVIGTTIVAADAPALALLAARRDVSVVGRDLFDFVAPGPPHVAIPGTAQASGLLVTVVRFDGAQEAMELTAAPSIWEGSPATMVTLGKLSGGGNRLQRVAIGIAADVPDAVFVTDVDFQVMAVNHAAERMTGRGEDELIGSCITAAMAWPGSDADLDAIADALHRSNHWHGEASQLGPRHGPMPVHTTVTVLRDAGGQCMGTVWVTRPTARPWRVRPNAPWRSAEARIRPQLDQSSMSLLYEPVIRADDGQPVALEARPASTDADLGLVDVRAIIDTLETPTVMEEIDGWLLRRACTDAALWQRTAPSTDLVVTVSGPTFSTPDFTGRVAEALADAGISPQRLWIKIAERALVADIDRGKDTLERLVDLGVRVMMDEFGIGLPGLAYLARLPIQGLHIHPALVHELTESVRGAAGGVGVVVGLGKELGLAVLTNDVSSAEHSSHQVVLVEGSTGLGHSPVGAG